MTDTHTVRTAIPCPPTLWKRKKTTATTLIDSFIELLIEGDPVAFAGIHFAGVDGEEPVFIIVILQQKFADVLGWQVRLTPGTKDMPRLVRFDTDMPSNLILFRDTQMFCVAEADPRLTEENASQKELMEAVRFLLQFLEARGTPEGLVW